MNKSEKFAKKIRCLMEMFHTGSVHTIGIDRYDLVKPKNNYISGNNVTELIESSFGNKTFRGTEQVKSIVTGSSLEMRKMLSRNQKWFVFVVTFKATETGEVHKQEYDIIL